MREFRNKSMPQKPTNKSAKPCFHYMYQGKCKLGDYCRFRHRRLYVEKYPRQIQSPPNVQFIEAIKKAQGMMPRIDCLPKIKFHYDHSLDFKERLQQYHNEWRNGRRRNFLQGYFNRIRNELLDEVADQSEGKPEEKTDNVLCDDFHGAKNQASQKLLSINQQSIQSCQEDQQYEEENIYDPYTDYDDEYGQDYNEEEYY